MSRLCDANVISCSPSTLYISFEQTAVLFWLICVVTLVQIVILTKVRCSPMLQVFGGSNLTWRGRPLSCHTSCLQVESFMFCLFIYKKSPSVRTHPRLVEAAVLAAHAEGFDSRRRLLCHQQSLLQLNLLLQLHQHRRLHAVPEKHTAEFTEVKLFLNDSIFLFYCVQRLTWRRCARSPADRDKPAEAPCAALRRKTQLLTACFL